MDLRVCPDHYSPLKYTKISSKCDVCIFEDHHYNEQSFLSFLFHFVVTHIVSKQGYTCDSCAFCVHEECMSVNIPLHHKHPLKLAQGDYSKVCVFCKNDWKHLIYQCSQCAFRICVPCARKPLIINQIKAHEHELFQLPTKLPFTCDACGLCSTEYPCLCLQCCFIIHRACIYLPRVIYINRHDHRISHVYSLGPGEWVCGVCYEPVNGEYGAYSCLVCSYVVHSKCATDDNIWYGKECEEQVHAQDVIKESKPFKVIDQNLIKQFSHDEHNLKASLASSRLEEPREHCYACTLPFDSELCYKCTQCDFILHDACTNLPLKKRHEISTRKLTLYANSHNILSCDACERYFIGFSYNGDRGSTLCIDVRCASVSGGYKHESHPHWLFVTYRDWLGRRCNGCDSVVHNLVYLRCTNKDDCGSYGLCFTCATLPTVIRHKYDDHPLSLYYGEKNMNATYFCGICEEEVDSKSWFYTCNDCESTLHTKCVFQNLIYSRPRYSLNMGHNGLFDLLPNRVSRPICYICKSHCVGDFFLNKKTDKNKFICISCGFNTDFLSTDY